MNIVENQNHSVADNSEIKKSVLWIYYVIFFAVLNESVFNVSTPSIAEQFGLDASGVSWVVTIFFIVFGMGMVIFGKLSDIYSIKKLITIGISLYAIGSILGFVCQSWYPAVILSRAIQGAGGSAIPALIFVMVARFFTVKERGKMFGIITSTVSFAIGIGPVLGGYIAGSFHWAFLFLISVPVVIAIPFFQKFLPVEPRKTGKLDVVGAVLLGIVISMLILFTTNGNWIYLGIVLIAFFLFIVQIRRAKEPFVEPALFKNSLYRNGLIIGFLIFGTVMSVMFVIPLMLRKMYGLDTEHIGLIMFPGAISAVVFGKIAGNMTVKRGSHYVVYLGLISNRGESSSAIFSDRTLGMVHWSSTHSDVHRIFFHADGINGKYYANFAGTSNWRGDGLFQYDIYDFRSGCDGTRCQSDGERAACFSASSTNFRLTRLLVRQSHSDLMLSCYSEHFALFRIFWQDKSTASQ